MDIIAESVKKLEGLTEHSGCSGAGVILDVDTKAEACQFEQGVSMTATFGGRSAVFTTYDPIRAPTKISFMFGAPLDTLPVRGAATAVINVVLGFLCMTRVLHACPISSHAACIEHLQHEIAGKNVFCIGSMGKRGSNLFPYCSEKPSDADIILINGEGLIDEKTGDIIEEMKKTKRVICIGPSTTGIARLYDIEHWCPYGRNCRD